MDFELTISGLVVLALRSPSDKPVEPEAVDVICPDACHHRPRLSYLPSQVIPAKDFERIPEMAIDPSGGRIASLDLREMALEISFTDGPGTPFQLAWGDPSPSAPLLENSLNWVPTLDELGFDGFPIGARGDLPKGAATRLTLPEGELFARNIIRTPDSAGYLLWNFPAKGVTKALANEMVFRACRVGDVIISSNGKTILTSSLGPAGTLRMSLANDVSSVVRDYNSPQSSLDHLSHMSVLCPTRGQFQAPTVVGSVPPQPPKHTIRPVCNGTIFVYKGMPC